jgi:hypothetical protein
LLLPNFVTDIKYTKLEEYESCIRIIFALTTYLIAHFCNVTIPLRSVDLALSHSIVQYSKWLSNKHL